MNRKHVNLGVRYNGVPYRVWLLLPWVNVRNSNFVCNVFRQLLYREDQFLRVVLIHNSINNSANCP